MNQDLFSPETPRLDSNEAPPQILTDPVAFAPGAEPQAQPAAEAPAPEAPAPEAPAPEAPAPEAPAPEAAAPASSAEEAPAPPEESEPLVPAPKAQGKKFAVVSVGEWIWSLLLALLPGLGLIFMFLFAFGAKKQSKRTLFQALLIFTAVLFAIALVAYGVLALLVGCNLLSWDKLFEIFD